MRDGVSSKAETRPRKNGSSSRPANPGCLSLASDEPPEGKAHGLSRIDRTFDLGGRELRVCGGQYVLNLLDGEIGRGIGKTRVVVEVEFAWAVQRQ